MSLDSELWRHFKNLSGIPRPSGHEGAAIDYVANVAKEAGCETVRDDFGSILIRVGATKGMSDRPTTILQGHIDMVPQKEPESEHNFLTDSIKLIEDGQWLHADRTTLGADNGIGVAAALATMTDPKVEHGPLEILITTQEETTMGGANALSPNVLSGKLLLNLDTEEEGKIFIGCAGGLDVSARIHHSRVETAPADICMKLCIGGLHGGHSGMDIQLGRANAIKLMTRFLKFSAATYESMLCEISGGTARNAIPRNCTALVTIDEEDEEDFREAVEEFEEIFRSEYASIEPSLSFTTERVECPSTVLDEMSTDDLINALQAAPSGVCQMSADVDGLVETSVCLSIVETEGDVSSVHFLVRSATDSRKADVASSIESLFSLAGAEIETFGEYPGWAPRPHSANIAFVSQIMKEKLGYEPQITAVHAGLECAIIGSKYPNLDMLSFGPTIEHPHSPSERVNIATVDRFYDILCAILRNIKN